MTDYFNQIIEIGRLGKVPEIRYFESGKRVVKVTLAVEREPKDKVKTDPDSPNWFNVEAWDGLADTLVNYATKGTLIKVEGEYQIEKWQDKGTQVERYQPVIKAVKIRLISGAQNTTEKLIQSTDTFVSDDDDF